MRTTLLLFAFAAIAQAGPMGIPVPTSCGQTPVKPNLSAEGTGLMQPAVPYSWPWQVDFCTRGWYGSCTTECAGTVIDNRWVLLAGQCVYDELTPNVYLVKAGLYRKDAMDESGEQISHVKSIHLHPKYSTSSKNDIALIELETPLEYSDTVQPICLPTNDSTVTTKPNSAYVTGWGSSVQLRQIKVPIVDYETCEKKLPDGIVDEIMVCAGEEGPSSWQVNTGSPMVVQGASGSWFQIGISSFKITHWKTDEVGVYSRVTAFCDFISSTTSGKVSCQPIA